MSRGRGTRRVENLIMREKGKRKRKRTAMVMVMVRVMR